MKKILFLLLFMIPLIGFSQDIFWEQIRPISAQVELTSPVWNDLILIEDSTGNKKYIKISNVTRQYQQDSDTTTFDATKYNLAVGLAGKEPINANIQSHITNDADFDPTNEIQNLSLGTKTGTVQPIYISLGGTGVSIDVADNDNNSTNELNSSMGWVDATNTVSVVDAGGTKSIAITGFLGTESLGVSNGVATLDSGGKIPLTQINDVLLGSVKYQGIYNATTNVPTLPLATDSKGYYYIISTAGTQQSLNFVAGDWIISNGVSWGRVDNNNLVHSVYGRVGNITANSGDYNTDKVTEAANLYYTEARVNTNTNVNANTLVRHGVNDSNTTSNTYADGKVADVITNGVTTIAPSQNAVFDELAGKYSEMYEVEVTVDGQTSYTLPFQLQSKTMVFYNGALLKSSLWAGVGTIYISIVLDTKTKDYIKIQN